MTFCSQSDFYYFGIDAASITTLSLFNLHSPSSRYHVTTADGQNFTAAKLILCPGAWGNDLLAHFNLKLDMQVYTYVQSTCVLKQTRRAPERVPNAKCHEK